MNADVMAAAEREKAYKERIAALERENAELRAALKPFADYAVHSKGFADKYKRIEPSDEVVLFDPDTRFPIGHPTVGDCRRAATALGVTGEKGE